MLEGFELSNSKWRKLAGSQPRDGGLKLNFRNAEYGKVRATRCCIALPFQCAELSLHDLQLC